MSQIDVLDKGITGNDELIEEPYHPFLLHMLTLTAQMTHVNQPIKNIIADVHQVRQITYPGLESHNSPEGIHQDGCDYICSYCTIPMARGKSRSARISEIVKLSRSLEKKGFKEIVLSGINLGDFGNGRDEFENRCGTTNGNL